MLASQFPILTFDDASLSPTFGYVFDARWLDPFESLVGMLWKFAAMNRIAGHVIVRQVSRRAVDPYEGIDATAVSVDVPSLATSLGVSQKLVRMSLCRPDCRRGWCSELRFCPRCVSRGYHGIVHQLGSQPHCPVHGCWLESVCRSCKSSSAYRLTAKLFDAPFRCAQCHAPYSRSAARFANRRPLPKRARSAITRAAIS